MGFTRKIRAGEVIGACTREAVFAVSGVSTPWSGVRAAWADEKDAYAGDLLGPSLYLHFVHELDSPQVAPRLAVKLRLGAMSPLRRQASVLLR